MNHVISSTNIGKSVKNTLFIPLIFEIKDIFLKLLCDKNEDEQRIYIFDIYKHYINLILTGIEEYNNHILDERNSIINRRLIKFVSSLLSKRYSVKTYTTNYDNLIPQVLSLKFKVYEALKEKKNQKKEFIYDLQRFRRVLAAISLLSISSSRCICNTLARTVLI